MSTNEVVKIKFFQFLPKYLTTIMNILAPEYPGGTLGLLLEQNLLSCYMLRMVLRTS